MLSANEKALEVREERPKASVTPLWLKRCSKAKLRRPLVSSPLQRPSCLTSILPANLEPILEYKLQILSGFFSSSEMSHSKTSIRFFLVNLGADFPRNAAFDMGYVLCYDTEIVEILKGLKRKILVNLGADSHEMQLLIWGNTIL